MIAAVSNFHKGTFICDNYYFLTEREVSTSEISGQNRFLVAVAVLQGVQLISVMMNSNACSTKLIAGNMPFMKKS